MKFIEKKFTDEYLKRLKEDIALDESEEDQIHLCDIRQMKALIARLEAAEAIANASKTMDEINNFGDRIYDVRERECLGWEGPKVKAYGKALGDFADGLYAWRESKGESI